MRKAAIVVGAVACVLGGVGAWWWSRSQDKMPVEEKPLAHAHSREPAVTRKTSPGPPRERAEKSERATQGLPAAEKAARIEKIKRDYDEIRTKSAADYSAAGAKFPGGLNAFLRQLAMLEREKRADMAAFLSAQELEDLEYRETTAGQLVERLLRTTTATEDQRRAVFREQLAFDDAFALHFDISPPALLEREVARQRLQERIRRVLGDELFAAWLTGEGPDFGNFTRFVAEQRLPHERAFELWQLKNEFIRKRLELGAQKLPVQQLRSLQSSLNRETQARVVGILGPGAMARAQREVLGWLPVK